MEKYMSNVKWIVDRHIFEDQRVPKKAFENNNIDYFEFEYIPFTVGKMEDIPFSTTEPVVVYGTVNAVRNLKGFYGCYMSERHFMTNVYMSLFGTDHRNFLNDDHLYCTFEDLLNNSRYYYDLFGKSSLFFRPLDGIKSFTGSVISRLDIDRELEIMDQLYNVPAESMIMISTPKKLYEESRFLIANREVVDYSRYRREDRLASDHGTDECCVMFAEEVIENTPWTPDDLFTLDIALTPDGPKIIELNSFSCAGWYGMNVERVIKKISEVVRYNFKEENKII